jgi:hypothetical protein
MDAAEPDAWVELPPPPSPPPPPPSGEGDPEYVEVSRAQVRQAALEHVAACVELLVLPAGRACDELAPDAVLDSLLLGGPCNGARAKRLRLGLQLGARHRSPRTALGAAARALGALWAAKGYVGAAVSVAQFALVLARLVAVLVLCKGLLPPFA